MPTFRAAAHYWLVIIVVALLTGTVAAAYDSFNATSDAKTSLLDRSKSIAELISAEDLAKLSGDESDTRTDTYNDIKQRLVRLRQSYDDIKYIYIVGITKDGRPYYVVDSEIPGTYQYANPGQPYPEGLTRIQSIFNTKEGRILPSVDQQSDTITAFSPITNYASDNVSAILGMDTTRRALFMRIAQQAIAPIWLTLVLIVVVLWARRRAQLQQQFVSEKAFFLSFASHEIRGPLVSVAWALEYIAKQKNAPPIFLERATASIRNILDTIEDVMEMQKTEHVTLHKPQRHPVQIHGILYQIIDGLYLTCKEHDVNVSDTTSEANKQFIASVDPNLFERVLATLLLNAIKHSPPNGVVTVSLSQSDHHWYIRVHNDGEPIAEADQKHLFRDYSKTSMAKDKRYKAVGFGLLLAFEIISQHGGELSVESQEKEGVTMLITMPKRAV